MYRAPSDSNRYKAQWCSTKYILSKTHMSLFLGLVAGGRYHLIACTLVCITVCLPVLCVCLCAHICMCKTLCVQCPTILSKLRSPGALPFRIRPHLSGSGSPFWITFFLARYPGKKSRTWRGVARLRTCSQLNCTKVGAHPIYCSTWPEMNSNNVVPLHELSNDARNQAAAHLNHLKSC